MCHKDPNILVPVQWNFNAVVSTPIKSKLRITQKVEYGQARQVQLIMRVDSHSDANNDCCDTESTEKQFDHL